MLCFLITLWARNAIPRNRCGEISERSGMQFRAIDVMRYPSGRERVEANLKH